MRQLGQRAVTVWLSPLQWRRLDAAAKEAGFKLAAWIRHVSLEQAGPR